MIDSFEVFTKSLAKTGKPKNGDHCDYVVLQQEPLIVALALGDGVGSKPCDGEASATAVTTFLQHIAKSTTQNLRQRMQEACEAADEQVTNAPKNCQGMLTTFVAVVWEVAISQIHYTSVGDSRIYLQSAGHFEQLTEDDAITQTKKVGGQTQLRSYITQVLGAGTAQFDIQTRSFLPNETVWLASDGFYEAIYQIGEMLTALWKYEDFNRGVSDLFQHYQSHYQDDASVIALRNNAIPAAFESDFQAWKQQHYPLPLSANLEQPALIRTIFEQLHLTIQAQQADETLQLCQLIDTLEIQPTLSGIEGLLGACQQANFNHQAVYKALRGLLMKAVK
ncbi:MAG TPA: hypothetical protein DCS93_35110 [Microscillaceae bacterium]|nr:hypothetical protein [Microscillaceae bacterium]